MVHFFVMGSSAEVPFKKMLGLVFKSISWLVAVSRTGRVGGKEKLHLSAEERALSRFQDYFLKNPCDRGPRLSNREQQLCLCSSL